MVTQDDIPTGNLQLTKRTWLLLLRRDHFYTEPTRPTGENPLLLNVAGYSGVAALGLGILSTAEGWMAPPFVIGMLLLAFLQLFIVCFGLHLVLWTGGTLWRLATGRARIGPSAG